MTTDMVRLCDIATVIAGQSPPGHTYNEYGSGLPFFQGKADFGELYPVARKWCVAPRKIAEAGDILVSVRAPVGPTNVARERCCIGRGLAAVRADEAFVLRDFVHWNIKHRQSELIAKGQGSTFAAIKQKDLKSLPIHLPPLAEQRRMVNILNRAAKIERLQKQAQERLREFIPALFIKMFGDPVENPMGWPIRKFAEVCMRVTVGLVVKPASYYRDEGVPALRSLNVREEYINEKNMKFFSREDTENKLAKSRVWKDDVVIVRSGQPGTATVIPAHLDGVNAIDILIATPNQSYVTPMYLSGFLNSTAGRRLVLSEGRGQIQKHLNVGSLSKAYIPVPPLSHQRQYVDIIEAERTVQSVAESSGSRSFELKNSLMSRLLEDGT